MSSIKRTSSLDELLRLREMLKSLGFKNKSEIFPYSINWRYVQSEHKLVFDGYYTFERHTTYTITECGRNTMFPSYEVSEKVYIPQYWIGAKLMESRVTIKKFTVDFEGNIIKD